MKRLAAAALVFALALLGAPSESLAQTVKVIGAVTPGHCVSFFSTTQIQDAGGVCGGGGGGGISGPGISTIGHLAVWSNNTGTAIADTNLSFAGGFSFVGTLTGATNVTFPTSGTLATTANANVASVTGTTGQITASPTTGAVTLSLPTTITQSETFSGTVNHTGPFQINGTPLTLPVSLTNGGTNNAAMVASAGGIVWSDASKLNVLAGTSTAGQCLLSGNLAAPTWGTCPGGAGVTSVANFAADTSLTLSGSGGGPPWIGAVTIKLNLANAQTWTAAQTFSGTVNVTGSFQIGGVALTLPVTLANGGTNAVLVASAGGIVWSDATKLNILAGTSTAGQCLLSGNLATPTWGSCTGGAAVSSVSAADTSLTISPTTGAVTAKVNLANAFVWTNPHKWVGAGTQILISNNAAATAATNQGIDVIEDGVPVSLNLISYGVNNTVNMPTFVGATARGSFAAPAAVQANDVLASFSGRGYTGAAFATVGRGFVRFFASETWGSGANGTYISFATTPTGTLATAEALRIENDGGLTVPTTVTGGSKGSGSINAGAFYIGGVQLSLPVSLANGGTNNALTASAGGIVWSDASKLNILAGTSTAGLCLLSGNLAAPTWATCPGPVSSVSGTIGQIIVSPTTGAVVVGLPSTITANETFSGTVNFSGTFQIGGNTVTLPISLVNGGTNNSLTASAGGVVWSDATKLNILAGTSTAGQCLLSGNLAAPTWGACSGAAGVASVTNSDGTLTISPTTGAVVASLALGHANTWSGVQTYNNGTLSLAGATSGNTLLQATAAAGAGTIATFPANTGTVAELNLAQTFSAAQTFSVANGIIYSGATTGTQVACLGLDASNNVIKSAAACGAGGGGTPGGSSGQVQYNNAGAFGGFGNWDGSAVFEQRNSTTAQTFNVYNTFTNSSNYERGVFDWSTTANVLTIGTAALGTGTVRNMQLRQGNDTWLDYGIANAAFINAHHGWWFIDLGVMLNSGQGKVLLQSSVLLAWTPGAVSGITADSGLSRAAPSVVQFNDGTAANTNGWLQWAGETRVTGDVTYTSTAALASVAGLSVNVQAGRTYSFVAEIFFTAGASAGGIQVAIAGTATATNIIYEGIQFGSGQTAVAGVAQATALGTAVANAVTAATSGVAKVTGTITVNAAGTLLVQAAQNTSSGTSTVLKRGSTFIVHDMP